MAESDAIDVRAPHVAGRFLLIFLPLVTLTGAVLAAVYWNQARTEQALLASDQRNHVELLGEGIVADFQTVVSDLMILAHGRTLRSAIETNDADVQARLAEDFRLVSQRKGLYDQIRFLDETGREVVRVNLQGGSAVRVPPEQLQPKASRYYFEETMRLGPEEVFVSPFDLNVEQGKIEQPQKPTIRFATPVFDHENRKRGIVVLNYLGSALVAKLERGAASVGRTLLVNRDGYWLRGFSAEDEWGFMYPERRERTFAARFDDAWSRMSDSDQGQFRTGEGLFTFRSVEPDLAAQPNARSSSQSAGADRWLLVSYVPATSLGERSRSLAEWLFATFLGVTLVLAVVSWYFAQSIVRHRQAEQQLLQAERLAAIGEAMTALAHESRNALQRSQAGLEMLAKRVKNQPEAAELLAEIVEAQHYLHEIYERVRDYAAPMMLARREIDLGEIARATWRQVVTARGGEPKLVEEPTTVNLKCMADPLAMCQVFRNVLDNALAASPAKAEVRLTWAETKRNGQSTVTASIRDNGPGLSREQRQRIFEPFYTTKTRGTGLGMCITRRIVEAHGGEISVGGAGDPQAAAGQGAEIVITLPRGLSSPRASQPRGSA
ncbi:MAG: ATP-binding protein [Pirellulales bacterium]